MRINLYLSESEGAFVRSKGRGYLRKLVQSSMAVRERVETEAVKVAEVRQQLRTVTGPTCKQCGALVMAGKCLNCGRKS